MLLASGCDLADRAINGGDPSIIRWQTEGVPGEQVFTIEWANAGMYDEVFDSSGSSLSYVNLQVRLFEADNSIEYHYGPDFRSAAGAGPLLLQRDRLGLGRRPPGPRFGATRKRRQLVLRSLHELLPCRRHGLPVWPHRCQLGLGRGRIGCIYGIAQPHRRLLQHPWRQWRWRSSCYRAT